MSPPGVSARQRLVLGGTHAVEAAVLAGLFLFYLCTFDRSSPVNGPFEVFWQDSVYLLEALIEGEVYPWNPQSHLLYHYVVEGGHEIWQKIVGSGDESSYLYLKLFTALCGLGFLAGMRWLFVELGLPWVGRIALLLLCGLSVTAWFHFAAFETHALAMPALAVYLVALVRLRDRPWRAPLDRSLLIGSLLVCGLTRVDLFRFAVVSALLPALPGLRRHWRSLVVDLALVGVLWGVGSAWLAHAYQDKPLAEAATAALDRQDRPGLSKRLGSLDNLEPRTLARVARAVSLYSIAMPVEPPPSGRSFFAPPTYVLNPKSISTDLFLAPARNMLWTALSLSTLAVVAPTLLWAGVSSAKRAARGDVLHAMLLAQAGAGLALYTWFNPFEPFLWSLEFMPLWVIMLVDNGRSWGRRRWVGLGFGALVIGTHNWFAFYLPFR